MVSATDTTRSLNEPVGLTVSFLIHSSPRPELGGQPVGPHQRGEPGAEVDRRLVVDGEAGQGLAAKVTGAAQHPGIVGGGLLIALVCLLVGSAAGALCNPPLLRHPAAAMLSTLAAIIVALAVDVSPASAAISRSSAQAAGPLTAHWPGAGPLAGAACLLAVAWGISVAAATRRDNWSPSVN